MANVPFLVERRLRSVSRRLQQLRADLDLANEQLAHFVDHSDDARIRSLVSETPLAAEEHREAHRHSDAMQRHRADLLAKIARLEGEQDSLLDALQAGRKGGESR
jgi:uncharacterized protein (DUF3084 family)